MEMAFDRVLDGEHTFYTVTVFSTREGSHSRTGALQYQHQSPNDKEE
jgi:hypothetical protein